MERVPFLDGLLSPEVYALCKQLPNTTSPDPGRRGRPRVPQPSTGGVGPAGEKNARGRLDSRPAFRGHNEWWGAAARAVAPGVNGLGGRVRGQCPGCSGSNRLRQSKVEGQGATETSGGLGAERCSGDWCGLDRASL